MLDPFIFIQGIRKASKDPCTPVLLEIERRRPDFRRNQRLRTIGLCALAAILLYLKLMGWDIL